MPIELQGAVVTIYQKKDMIRVAGMQVNPLNDGYKYGEYTFITNRTGTIIEGKFKIQKTAGGCIDLIPFGNVIIENDNSPTKILVVK
jgi:hypothetical protein